MSSVFRNPHATRNPVENRPHASVRETDAARPNINREAAIAIVF